MYIKLTKLNGSPIWLNASFIVTIEAGRNGGAVVVPIGDGLDYDVRESPETVLGMLSAAPVAAVVPVPAPKGLTATPEDVSPETGVVDVARMPVSAEASPESQTSAETDATAARAAGSRDGEKPKSAAKVRKIATRPRSRGGRKVKLDLTEEQLGRLRKMAPGSLRKLLNTVLSQFKVTDPEHTIRGLVDHEIVAIDEQEHVNWLLPPEPPSGEAKAAKASASQGKKAVADASVSEKAAEQDVEPVAAPNADESEAVKPIETIVADEASTDPTADDSAAKTE